MATPLSATALVSALRAEGCKVVEVRDWRTHNRNHKGPWGPVNGVMIHHTVTSGTQRTIDICYDGYTALPGPLCHGVIAKSGTVYLVGNGRANHAGSGDDDVLDAVIAEEATPVDNEANTDGNRHFYGFECENLGDGEDPWPAAQLEAIVRASAALCRAHGWNKDGAGVESVIGHKEWQPGKPDPRGVDMDAIRRRVDERLRHPASWNSQEDDVALTTDDINKVAAATVAKLLAGGGALETEDIHRIWKTDGFLPAPVASETNPYWAPFSFVRDNNIRLRKVEEKVDALTVGGVDLDALAAKVADLLAARLAQ